MYYLELNKVQFNVMLVTGTILHLVAAKNTLEKITNRKLRSIKGYSTLKYFSKPKSMSIMMQSEY